MNYRAMQDLTGRLALVTGAGQGIGAAIAEALADTGAEVICTDIDPARAQAVAGTLREKGLQARAETLDITDSGAIDALAAKLPPLDILVCNAGIVSNIPAEHMNDATWDRMIAVNLSGVFRTCRGFGRRMLEAERGVIVNVGSMSGNIVNVPQPQAHYNSAKAGVHHLTKSLAVEWASRNIRVNAVAPTYIETPLLKTLEDQPGLVDRWMSLTPGGRMGQPHEVAAVVQFLASDAASLLTGAVVSADAGYTCI